ncbi:hypothetical protein P7H48_03845 [Enterococcus lactis]|uniref:hypothetical protein n=1 Tax=Enterococcus lactis TaxID=357441 RepID=UPI00288E21E4|nr:hypothetical protein [Enterococcus lactis]MDT2778370.1 hypothetical protein [Enterococcus lactis]
MKKKFIPLVILAALSLAACGSSDNSSSANSSSKTSESTTVSSAESKKDLPSEDQGTGTMYLSGPGGTTENGETLTIFDDGDTQVMQIGMDVSELDGNKLSYIYIDGSLSSKEQVSTGQSTLGLTKENLTPGRHTVNLVQYDNNNEDGSIITNKVANYEVTKK